MGESAPACVTHQRPVVAVDCQVLVEGTLQREPATKINDMTTNNYINLIDLKVRKRGGPILLILSATEQLQLLSQHFSGRLMYKGRRRLRSASTSTIVVPLTRRATIGNRAFPAAASPAWNSLPTSVREIQSLPAFRRKLKTTLFAISFPAD